MKDQGVIQDSRSQWNSPIFLAPKNDGSYRPVIDFHRFSEVTEDERYPFPVLKKLLMSSDQCNTVSRSLDLLNLYLQVKMVPAFREVTAFSTPHAIFNSKG